MTDQSWPTDTVQAVAVQSALRDRVMIADDFAQVELIAGVDVSYDLATNMAGGYVVLMRRDALKLLHSVTAFRPVTFPYIPGFLSFREVPVILDALAQLPDKPDLLMVDGQGVAHPRGFGIAAHLGVLTGLPAIGIAKSRLCGRHDEPGPAKGDWTPLMDKGLRIGSVLRSKAGVKPLFISPGHRVAQDTALQIVQECLCRHRLPEPTRLADRLSKIKQAPLPLLL